MKGKEGGREGGKEGESGHVSVYFTSAMACGERAEQPPEL